MHTAKSTNNHPHPKPKRVKKWAAKTACNVPELLNHISDGMKWTHENDDCGIVVPRPVVLLRDKLLEHVFVLLLALGDWRANFVSGLTPADNIPVGDGGGCDIDVTRESGGTVRLNLRCHLVGSLCDNLWSRIGVFNGDGGDDAVVGAASL